MDEEEERDASGSEALDAIAYGTPAFVAYHEASLHDSVRSFFTQSFGARRLQRILAGVRRPPSQSTLRVNALVVSSPKLALEQLVEELRPWYRGLGERARLLREAGAADGGESILEKDVPLEVKGASPPHVHPFLPDVIVVPSAQPPDVSPDCLRRLKARLPRVVISRPAAEAVLRGAHCFAAGVMGADRGRADLRAEALVQVHVELVSVCVSVYVCVCICMCVCVYLCACVSVYM